MWLRSCRRLTQVCVSTLETLDEDFTRPRTDSWRSAERISWPTKPQGEYRRLLDFVERNALAHLDCLFFVRGSPAAIDLWSFVQYCRTTAADHNRAHTGWYDMVVGPVIGSWQKKQTVIPDGDQLSFHTDASASVLDNSQKVQVL